MDDVGPWEKIKVIGKGGSSTVYKGILKSNGTFVAVKEIQTDGLNKDQILAIKGEVETIKKLAHENIVQYVGTQQSSNNFYILLEYVDRGSLRQYYQKHGALKESQVAYCMNQMLHGLQYLHGVGIAHRDIKGANILLTKKSLMKLADFGASKKFDTESLVSGLKGTPHWMAPEVIKGTQLSEGWFKADVWSVGCTVVELITGKIPYFMYENPMTAMYHIASGEAPPFCGVDEPSENVKSFVQCCCNPDPTLRPNITTLLQHPFVINANKMKRARRKSLSCSERDISLLSSPTPLTSSSPKVNGNNNNSPKRRFSFSDVDIDQGSEEGEGEALPLAACSDDDNDDNCSNGDNNNNIKKVSINLNQVNLNNRNNNKDDYNIIQDDNDDCYVDIDDDLSSATYIAGGGSSSGKFQLPSSQFTSQNINRKSSSNNLSISQQNTPVVHTNVHMAQFAPSTMREKTIQQFQVEVSSSMSISPNSTPMASSQGQRQLVPTRPTGQKDVSTTTTMAIEMEMATSSVSASGCSPRSRSSSQCNVTNQYNVIMNTSTDEDNNNATANPLIHLSSSAGAIQTYEDIPSMQIEVEVPMSQSLATYNYLQGSSFCEVEVEGEYEQYDDEQYEDYIEDDDDDIDKQIVEKGKDDVERKELERLPSVTVVTLGTDLPVMDSPRTEKKKNARPLKLTTASTTTSSTSRNSNKSQRGVTVTTKQKSVVQTLTTASDKTKKQTGVVVTTTGGSFKATKGESNNKANNSTNNNSNKRQGMSLSSPSKQGQPQQQNNINNNNNNKGNSSGGDGATGTGTGTGNGMHTGVGPGMARGTLNVGFPKPSLDHPITATTTTTGNIASDRTTKSKIIPNSTRHSKSAGIAKNTANEIVETKASSSGMLPPMNLTPSPVVHIVPTLTLRHIQSAPTTVTRLLPSNFLPPIVSLTPNNKPTATATGTGFGAAAGRHSVQSFIDKRKVDSSSNYNNYNSNSNKNNSLAYGSYSGSNNNVHNILKRETIEEQNIREEMERIGGILAPRGP
eukprot:gene10167-21193_t